MGIRSAESRRAGPHRRVTTAGKGKERLSQRVDVLVTTIGILRKGNHDRRLERRGKVGRNLLKRRGGLRGDRRRHPRYGSLERRLAGDELVENDAEGPDVASLVHVLRRPKLLGRHIERRAERRAGRRL